MTAVKYRVPYEFTVKGRDTQSGKLSNNVYFFRADFQPDPQPAYGSVIAGASLETAIVGMRAAMRSWHSQVSSVNFVILEYQLKEVVAAAAGRFFYGDSAVLSGGELDAGGIAGDALPMHSTLSGRIITGVAGRRYRGGKRYSPVPESHWEDGHLSPAGTIAVADATNTLLFNMFNIDNGGTIDFSNDMDWCLASYTRAVAVVQPFTQSESWCTVVSNFLPRTNNGVMRRRKPRLDAIIG